MGQRLAGRHEEVPEAGRLRLRLQLLDDGKRLPAIAGRELILIVLEPRVNLGIDEGAHAVEVAGLEFRKVHVNSGGCSEERREGKEGGGTCTSVWDTGPS